MEDRNQTTPLPSGPRLRPDQPLPVVVAISGASGAIFGVRVLERLQALDVETHLVISAWGRRTIEHETGRSVDEVKRLATATYGSSDQSALISSGSFLTAGMVVAPCSMRSLAAIAHGFSDSLLTRAADVVLKERRTLVLITREMPLHEQHLKNMLSVTRMGATVLPPVPAFYNHPRTIDDIVNHIVTRTLDQFGLNDMSTRRWTGSLESAPRGHR
jgi:4-hydroxy-3-polyprenylbenzoate decarboxylase